MAGYLRTKTHVAPTAQAGTNADTATNESAHEASVIIGREGVKVPAGDVRLTVSEVAKLTGVPATKLRHYDSVGVLCPARSGEGVSNNRKLYNSDDLDRLQTILTLSAYDFSLEEIRHVLDDADADLYEVMNEKLLALKLQENRLRNLIHFAQFIDLTDTELLEGLACGPADLDLLADFARRSPQYHQALQKLLGMSDEEAGVALEPLEPTVVEYLLLDETEGFAGSERVMDAFLTWWSDTIAPVEQVGYLGFWAIFEDHSLVAERVEAIGGEGVAGFLEMSAFFVMMKRLLEEQSATIHAVAELAEADVVAALESAQALVAAIGHAMLGSKAVEACTPEKRAAVALCTLAYAESILANGALHAYLELDDLGVSSRDIELVVKVVEVMCEEE